MSERVIGIDPGRVDMISAVESAQYGNAKLTSLSTGKCYNDSGLSRGLRRGVKWRKPTKDVGILLRDDSCKTAHDEQLSSCMTILEDEQVWDRLWHNKLQKKWRQQAFRLSGGKKRVIDTVASSLRSKDGPQPTIACGNGGFGSGGRRNRSVPVKRIKEAFQKAHDVRMMDEFNTSKTCPRCDNVLQEIRAKA